MRALSAIVNNCQFVLYPLNIDMNIEGGLRWPGQCRKYFLISQVARCATVLSSYVISILLLQGWQLPN